MIDLHCHILPGIDDGAKDEATCRKMFALADKQGVTAIIATPHYNSSLGPDIIKKREAAFRKAQKIAKAVAPDLKLYLGCEIFYDSRCLDALTSGEAVPLAGSRYVLIEFYPWTVYIDILRAVQKLRCAGYYPILAHIERYECLEREEHLQSLLDMGALAQINADTVSGKQGRKMRNRMLDLIHNDMVQIVSSDAHGIRHRRCYMKEASTVVRKKLGPRYERRIFKKNASKILKGERYSE